MYKILVVDDDSLVRRTIKLQLEIAGMSVKEAETGIDGCKLARRDDFDLAIIDILMPYKDGIETILELKAVKPALKVLAMSGGGRIQNDEFLRVASRLGADDTMAKPFQVQDLKAKVQALVSDTHLKSGEHVASAAVAVSGRLGSQK